MTRVEPQWVQHMREALEEFVQDVRQTLPERPSVADIERTLSWIERHLSGLSALEAQRQLMRDLMQSVVDDHAPPPPSRPREPYGSLRDGGIDRSITYGGKYGFRCSASSIEKTEIMKVSFWTVVWTVVAGPRLAWTF